MKKLLKVLLTIALCMVFTLPMLACGKEDPTQQEVIYQMYVTYAQAKGDTVQTYEQWLESVKGAAGAKGDKGDAGANGADGLDGKDGATWHHGTAAPANTVGSNGDFYFNTANASIYFKVDGAWGEPIITLKGADGEDGEDGTDGKDGATWLTGPKAPTAANGKDGDLYFATEDGKVYKRTAGAWNEIADLTGLKGDKGDSGNNGAAGVNGATWLTGELTGDNLPDNTLGTDGDLYLDKNSSKVYKKADGAWSFFTSLKGLDGSKGDTGAAGSDGADGTDGKDGATWHFGDVDPTGSANIGDMYLNTVSGDIFNKTADGWSKIANIKGTDGAAGADGVGIVTIEEKPVDRWGIVTKTVYTMTDETTHEIENEANPKYYKVYDAANEEEVRQLLGYHAAKIVLTADIALVESNLDIMDDCEFDLGGHTLSYENSEAVNKNKATIRGNGSGVALSIFNGTVIRTGSQDGRAIEFTANAIGSVEDVTAICEAGYGVTVYNGASITMNGSSVTSKWHAIGTNNLMGGARIVVENSKLASSNDVAVFLSSFTTTSINRSTVTGTNALHIMMGDVSVTNSKLIATSVYNPYTPDTINKSGTKEGEGAAIVIRSNLYYDSAMQTNDLTLNFVNNKTTTVSGVGVSLYNGNDKSGTLGNVADQTTVENTFDYAHKYFVAHPEYKVEEYVYQAGAGVAVWTEAELKAAIAAKGATSIRLLKDIGSDTTYSGNLVIKSDLADKIITLDLNGFKIFKRLDLASANSKETVVNAETKRTEFKPYDYKIDVTIKDSSEAKTGQIGSKLEDCMYGILLQGGANLKVTIDNVRAVGYYGGIYSNGSSQAGATVSATNSDFTGFEITESAGAYFAAGANYSFTDCEFVGAAGIHIKSGTLALINCELTAKGAYKELDYNGNGATITGAALAVESTVGYHPFMDVTVDGGILKSENGYAIQEAMTAGANVTPVCYLNAIVINESVSLTSADGKAPFISQNDKIVVGVNTAEEFQAALDAKAARILLMQDITVTNPLVVKHDTSTLVIDLAGYTIHAQGVRGLQIDSGNVTVKNGSMTSDGAVVDLTASTSAAGSGSYGTMVINDGSVVLEDLTLTNGRPWGMNVKITGGEAVLRRVTINANYGGGVQVSTKASFYDCTITQTGVFDHCSTAIGVSYGGEAKIYSGTYSSENAVLYVFNSGGSLDIQGGTFTAIGEKSRAIHVDKQTTASSSVSLRGDTFEINGAYKSNPDDKVNDATELYTYGTYAMMYATGLELQYVNINVMT